MIVGGATTRVFAELKLTTLINVLSDLPPSLLWVAT